MVCSVMYQEPESVLFSSTFVPTWLIAGWLSPQPTKAEPAPSTASSEKKYPKRRTLAIVLASTRPLSTALFIIVSFIIVSSSIVLGDIVLDDIVLEEGL